MSKDLEIVNQFNESYIESYNAWYPWYPLAANDLRMYQGDQWNQKEQQKLWDENRNAFVFNRIRRNINLVTGYQRKHRMSSMVYPVESNDQLTADQYSKALLYVLQHGDAYQVISDCFGGACKTGWNLATIWMDYRDDPKNGDICFGREPYSGFITDPYFTQLDFSDCGYLLRRKYISLDQTLSLLPGHEKDIKEIQKLSSSRDDKFTWLPYNRVPNGSDDYVGYNEFYQQKWKNVPMLVDMETGEHLDWEGDSEKFQILSQSYPNLKIVKKPKRYIERHILLNNIYFKTDINPYGLDEYPFVPFVAQFDSESEFWEYKIQSLVRCQIDPQRESNRRRSQMTDIIDSQINSGYIADEDSVINPRSLFQSSQGKVIWRKKDAKPGAIEKIQPAQIPPSMFQLQELFDKDMGEIMGVNDAAFGVPDSGNESGIMMLLRQGSAITNLQDVFDNLRFSQKMLSQKVVKLIQSWTPDKIKRIINQDPSPQFFDKTTSKFDIVVQEGVLTDTQKQVYFRQLLDIKQITDQPSQGPVTAQMVIEAAPMQGKSDLVKQIAQNEQQAAQQAQQQQQIQQDALQKQSQLAQSKIIDNLALAKERFTRAVSNIGLSDERSAKAVSDRNQGALDQIKAIKELYGMNQDQILKGLEIIAALQASSKMQETEIKSDDVLIASKGNEIGERQVQQAIPQPSQMMSRESRGSEPV